MKARLAQLTSWVKTNRKKAIIFGVVSLLLFCAVGFAAWKLTSGKGTARTDSGVKVKKEEPPKPTTKPSALTGEQLPIEQADRFLTAMVIENHPDSRPQSGLGDAGVVYEAIAEGGITRFLAFFHHKRPPSIGPVRSLRTYFVSWGIEYNAPVGHVGGNADALDVATQIGMKTLNQFDYGGHYFRTRDRFAPHNMYTTSDLIDQLMARLGYTYKPTFEGHPRKADQPGQAGANTININYSSPGFAVRYQYDAASNSYARFLAGQPHIDRNSGQQIVVKNVVVEYMPTAFGLTRIGEQTVRMGDSGWPVGSNRAVVFRDGGAVEGKWVKEKNETRTKLIDAAGNEIALNVGNTWFSIVPIGKTATYQ